MLVSMERVKFINQSSVLVNFGGMDHVPVSCGKGLNLVEGEARDTRC